MPPVPRRSIRPTTSALVALIALFGVAPPSRAQQAAGSASGAASPVKVKVPPAVTAKANAPTPPAKATKKAQIGKGKVTAKTANASDDADSFWVEEIDIDGDGNVESTDVIWDDEDKVLFLYAEGEFACAGGGVGAGDMLIALNGQGNPRGRPAGSGWYVVTLDESECKAKAAASFGCRFDAKGVETACGAATIDDKNDELVVVTASN
jgi:hypothetical protein